VTPLNLTRGILDRGIEEEEKLPLWGFSIVWHAIDSSLWVSCASAAHGIADEAFT
jgi:hypothetical protein